MSAKNKPSWSEMLPLVLRLLKDPRVPLWLKAIPILTVLYWLLPDPVPSPLDDATFFLLALWIFLQLAPKPVVEEHRRRLRGEDPTPGPVVDGHVLPPREHER